MSRTQRMVTGHRAEWLDGGDHLVVRTPTNPTFYGGNQIVLPGPPSASQLDALEETFGAAFPDAEHRSFDWPGDLPEDRAAFEAGASSTWTPIRAIGAWACVAR